MKTFQTQGTCSRAITYEVADGIVTACEFVGGCPGNTQGVAKLVVGRKVDDVLFYSCYDLTSVEIPSSVTSIGESAFWSCLGLVSLTVPSGVTSVGENAFAFCPAAVDFEGAPPEGLADSALAKGVALRYNVEHEDEWLLVVATCGFTNATAYDPQGPLPELVNPSTDDIRGVLVRATDEKLAEKITTATEYEAFRNWTGTVKRGDGELAHGSGVLVSPNAWLSFALGQDVLLERAPTNGQMKVEGFVQTATAGEYEFTVNIENIVVGSETSKENLKKVFGIEGGTTLEGLSSANVNISFGTPENGKVKFTAGPKDAEAKTFFMKVKMVP